MPKREDNMLAKIAEMLGKPVEEIKEQKALYTEQEAIIEAQSVLNYYNWRKKLVRQPKETDKQWEARFRVWQYKDCKGCKQRFAYSYNYDGVEYCSLDCLRDGLKEIGIIFTPGRPLNLRWGYKYPGIVPSSALQGLESVFAEPSSSSLPDGDADFEEYE